MTELLTVTLAMSLSWGQQARLESRRAHFAHALSGWPLPELQGQRACVAGNPALPRPQVQESGQVTARLMLPAVLPVVLP